MKKIILFFLLLGAVLVLGRYYSKGKKINRIRPSDKISFSAKALIFLGDTGTGRRNQYKVSRAINRFCNNHFCQAVFIVGDVIYPKGVSSVKDNQFISKFEKPYKDIKLPFYIAFGNHDYLGCIDCYLNYSTLSAKWNMPSQYYFKKFINDNLEIFVINTENFKKDHQTWLKKNLIKSKAKWKVVVGHRPIKTFEVVHHRENWSGKEGLRKTICNRADIYISGHSHLLEDGGRLRINKRHICKVKQLVSGGGGAWPRKVIKSNKDKFFYEGNGFLAISIKDERLIYQFINKDNRVIYRGRLN